MRAAGQLGVSSLGAPGPAVRRWTLPQISLAILLLAALSLFGPYLPAFCARLRGRRQPVERFAIGDSTE